MVIGALPTDLVISDLNLWGGIYSWLHGTQFCEMSENLCEADFVIQH